MAPQTSLPGVIESELSHMMGSASNAPLAETQQQFRHQLVHCNAAIAATENMTQDEQLEIVRKTGCSSIRNQHAIGCD